MKRGRPRSTFCLRGHERTVENVKLKYGRDGYIRRDCRKCIPARKLEVERADWSDDQREAEWCQRFRQMRIDWLTMLISFHHLEWKFWGKYDRDHYVELFLKEQGDLDSAHAFLLDRDKAYFEERRRSHEIRMLHHRIWKLRQIMQKRESVSA